MRELALIASTPQQTSFQCLWTNIPGGFLIAGSNRFRMRVFPIPQHTPVTIASYKDVHMKRSSSTLEPPNICGTNEEVIAS
mmetsp:Transcript_42208/g.78158  ORF Transcript_42208/g.78158 Transcript_42208/m.78158 type:complete len:81 (-) Transcript_42208:664-906(-)